MQMSPIRFRVQALATSSEARSDDGREAMALRTAQTILSMLFRFHYHLHSHRRMRVFAKASLILFKPRFTSLSDVGSRVILLCASSCDTFSGSFLLSRQPKAHEADYQLGSCRARKIHSKTGHEVVTSMCPDAGSSTGSCTTSCLAAGPNRDLDQS